MPLIHEAILTTLDEHGAPHVAPLGLIADGEDVVLAPFHPSATLRNLRANPFAAASFPDDARVVAGCLTGRRDWPLAPCETIAAPRLADALTHLELVVTQTRDDATRPRFRCRVAHRQGHKPYPGFTRAFAAVVEGAVLISRLRMTPRAEMEPELARLAIIVEKTAGPAEREAWGWLAQAAQAHWRGQGG